MKSIRSRLLLALLAGLAVVQILIYLSIYAKMEDEIDDLFDGELERSALSVSLGAAPLPVSTPHRAVVNPEEGMIISIWQDGGTRPTLQSGRLEGLTRATPRGFSKQVIERRQWRLFATQSGTLFVVAAQPADVRNAAARVISARILLPSLVALPVAALTIWFAVAFGLRPLLRITSELRTRSHRDLSPIGADRLPADIAPVVRALNDLMSRLGRIIAAQRNFIGDAAHELLTPLTALKLQARLLARSESPTRRRETVLELQGGVARTLQLAQQLLVLARHDADSDEQDMTATDVGPIVRDVMAIQGPLAQAKGIRSEVLVQDGCFVAGNEDALCTLVANLVDNAIKYSDLDGAIRVEARRSDRRVMVEIEDSGPGIPVDERERVFDRFYRRTGQTVGGSGLGLAIAREIAARHDAVITLHGSERLGGLLARVDFMGLDARAPGTDGLVAGGLPAGGACGSTAGVIADAPDPAAGCPTNRRPDRRSTTPHRAGDFAAR